jgi:hypothetical protein
VVDALRHHYLKTLGIVEYIPRGFVDDSEESMPSVQYEPSTEIRTTVIGQLLGDHGERSEVLVADSSHAEVSRDIPVDESATSVELTSVASVSIEVRIALWQPHDKLLVCSVLDNELPSPEHTQLLANILISMGHNTGALPQFEIAQWPPFDNMQGGEADAREFLSTLIGARLESSQTQMILMLGSVTTDWILSDQQKSDLEHGQVKIDEHVIAVVIPSLTDMIAQPELKRDAWNIIRPLAPNSEVHRQQETS